MLTFTSGNIDSDRGWSAYQLADHGAADKSAQKRRLELSMSVKTGLPPPSASEGPASSAGGDLGPVGGMKQAHADMRAWLYKPHGAAADAQLKKIDAAGVKREHIAYGLIGLTCLYLLGGEEAMFVSCFITFLYPASVSVSVSDSIEPNEIRTSNLKMQRI
ncbi:hypothetical protein OESDEN_00692 [Oesophagostomum dentatum]|uniref:Uncharacterized protein n=1 Tax=Oesophagostomum dentatum TaxID=61180 RepID=A0A0B1TTZ6_OESDE|nr:hypothetical protein OESDEN_00692 [Oesophagostomum dentatum]